MSQTNYNVANESAPQVRAKLNSIFGSIATNNSGSTAPSTTFAHQWWYDTSTNILKQRNAANSGWVNVGYFDQSAGAFRVLDDTQVVNTSGVQTGLLGDQATATWEAGTATTESLVSPAKVRASLTTSAILAATAGASVGAVGTYAWLGRNSDTSALVAGNTYSGSSLVYAGVVAQNSYIYNTALRTGGVTPAGTWRAMGSADSTNDPSKGTLFLRIS
jgi:hypothetical protein